MTITAQKTPVLSFNNTTADLTINGNTQLAVATKAGGNITVNGDATLNGVNLNGYTMDISGDVLIRELLTVGNAVTEAYGTINIDGNLQVTQGKVHLNHGAVNVGGNAVFAKINSDGSYSHTESDTYLVMNNDDDTFTVSGNLVTGLCYDENFQCSTGTLYIGGSWTNYCYYSYNSDNTLSGSGTFSVVFKGTDDLVVYGNGAIYVPNMTIENATSRSITMRGTVKAGTLDGGAMTITAQKTPVLSFNNTTADLTINGNTQLAVATQAGGNITVNGDLYSNGFKIGANIFSVNGNLYLITNNTLTLGPSGSLCVDGDVKMDTGTMSLAGTTTISGNLYQSGGDVKPNKGRITIMRDYRIQTADESTGELIWGTSDGRLHMVNDSDYILVNGGFYTTSSKTHAGYLTAGTLCISGDFSQFSGNTSNFKASGTHRVVLCGTEPQNVTFESASSLFNILELTQDISQYTFNPDPCWNMLGHTHTYTTQITSPTCTEGGYTTYTCECGDSYVADEVPALGHDWGNTGCTRCDATRENPFADVVDGSFYIDPVLWAVENGITNGTTPTTFNPNGTCLRAHVVTFLHRAAGNPDPTSSNNPFNDVKSGDFFYQPVLWAVEKGITNGTSATTFGSYANCNRAAVVTFLWRASGSPEPESTNNPFVDVKTTDFFYKPVLWAVEKGITNGVDATHFGPATDCNRAQVVTFLYRAYN